MARGECSGGPLDDEDREAALNRLLTAYGDGLLSPAETEERLAQVYATPGPREPYEPVAPGRDVRLLLSAARLSGVAVAVAALLTTLGAGRSPLPAAGGAFVPVALAAAEALGW